MCCAKTGLHFAYALCLDYRLARKIRKMEGLK